MESSEGTIQPPLANIRIADFTWWQSGPQATQYLAVLGAEVIKVESRQRLDPLRRLAGGTPFLALNRGKKSCTLNLTRPEAVKIVRELIKISDAVVENFAGGVMGRLGLDYQKITEIKPDIVMLSISGLGKTGPEKDYIAYAQTMHAYSGLSSLTGYPGGPPVSLGAFWGDQVAALAGAFSLLAALYHRKKTGQGQYIDLSMSETLSSMIPEGIMDYTMNRRVRLPMGNRDDTIAPHGCYRCRGKDEWVAIAVSTEEEWNDFRRVMGNPEWSRNDRFSTNHKRIRNQDELDRLIEGWTISLDAFEVMEALQRAGIAAGPSQRPEQLITDPQLRERGFFVEMDDPGEGEQRFARMPWLAGASPNMIHSPPPNPGEHNSYVFGKLLGMHEDEIRRLTKDKVIY
ncbi:MAG: CoA transferase [Thermodesulfobacteriota bacterium]|nr:CoA transferase [Thermodesulfobacteriota bacterium]